MASFKGQLVSFRAPFASPPDLGSDPQNDHLKRDNQDSMPGTDGRTDGQASRPKTNPKIAPKSPVSPLRVPQPNNNCID